jgi:hypothetical protein
MAKEKGWAKAKIKAKEAEKGLEKVRGNRTSAILATGNRPKAVARRRTESATTGQGAMVIANMDQIAIINTKGRKGERNEKQMRHPSLPLEAPRSPARNLSLC